MDKKDAIKLAICEAGGSHAVAYNMGISRQSVEEWVYRVQVPADRIITLEALSGVPRHFIDPVLYP